jgi:hypothetical protein
VKGAAGLTAIPRRAAAATKVSARAAHLPNLERTAEFDAAVLSFLDTIGGTR